MSWRIEFYKTASGKTPVKEFVDSLPEQAQAKFIFIMDLLEKYGIDVRDPYVKTLKGHTKLKEMRIKASGNIYRILYFPARERTFVLLHGFIKKGDKTPKNDIDTAEKRLEDYIARHS